MNPFQNQNNEDLRYSPQNSPLYEQPYGQNLSNGMGNAPYPSHNGDFSEENDSQVEMHIEKGKLSRQSAGLLLFEIICLLLHLITAFFSTKATLSMLILAIFLIVVGVKMAIRKQMPTVGRVAMAVVALLGTAGLAFGIVDLVGNLAEGSRILPSILGGFEESRITICFFVMLWFTFATTVVNYRCDKKANCTEKITAKVVRVEKDNKNSDNNLYLPIYEFFYGGRWHQYSEQSYKNDGKEPHFGDMQDIYFNPKDLNDAYIPTTGKSKNFNLYVFLTVLMGMVIVSLRMIPFNG